MVTVDVEVNLARLELSGSDRLQAIVRDITGRRRAEEAIKENENRLNSSGDKPNIR